MCYTNIKNSYSSRAKPSISSSDHNAVHLIPVYKTKLKSSRPVEKTVKVWSEESRETMKGSYLCTDWEVFQGENIDHTVTVTMDYMNFCVDGVIPSKKVKTNDNSVRQRESVESLIHKHSYARSPIRTYAGEEDAIGEDGHATHGRGSAFTASDSLSLSSWVTTASGFSGFQHPQSLSAMGTSSASLASPLPHPIQGSLPPYGRLGMPLTPSALAGTMQASGPTFPSFHMPRYHHYFQQGPYAAIQGLRHSSTVMTPFV
ncbi:hypothetical protein SKAU_G00218480 [Synaphobranchus kaupii]|uniref:Uncharacterized protein n=1 Tax=Synaphobranchus kaupii TaxID=118154 RepID=A0A9Q1FAA1_SYNKA|nr:hypothetical protein SKAU_G00218480 [Synaphobranchus kaupii]